MKTCRVGNTGESLDTPQCFGANSLYTGAQKEACENSVANTVPEDNGTGTWLKALPGCNPIQSGPGLATPQKDCPKVNAGDPGTTSATKATTLATSATSSVKVTTTTSATTSPSASSTSGGPASVTAADGSTWKADGCYVDTLNPRSLGTNGWWGNPMTNTECAKGCSKNGFSISGAEYGGQCFCGNSLSSKKVASSECNSKCAGDSSQLCGGPARLSVYRKSGSSSKQARAHRHLERHRQAVS